MSIEFCKNLLRNMLEWTFDEISEENKQCFVKFFEDKYSLYISKEQAKIALKELEEDYKLKKEHLEYSLQNIQEQCQKNGHIYFGDNHCIVCEKI